MTANQPRNPATGEWCKGQMRQAELGGYRTRPELHDAVLAEVMASMNGGWQGERREVEHE